MKTWCDTEVAYHRASAAIETRNAILAAVEAGDINAMADADGWVTSNRSGAAVCVEDDVSEQYMLVALHAIATAVHIECAARWAAISKEESMP